METQTESNIINYIYQKLLTIQIPPQLIIQNKTQSITNSMTWRDVFDFIKSKHWHTDGKYTCPHEESLFDHLNMCGCHCYKRACELDFNSKERIKAYLTGLLHDIGKPGTVRQLNKHLAFKGHGLVGGAILENFWSPELESLGIDQNDWADISTCADVHMCSYFPNQTTPIHKFSLNILPMEVKQMLYVLREGDQLSMIPSSTCTFNKTVDEIKEFVISNRESYLNTIVFDQPFESINKNMGILIFVQGCSSAGKSTFAKKLINRFGSKCTYVNRDWYMVTQTLKVLGSNQFDTLKPDQISPQTYQLCYQKYLDSNKLWAPQINDRMKRDIHDGLQQGKIVIVDTLATMFDSIDVIVPPIALDAYRFSFWLHRNRLITEEESFNRLGMDLDKQLEIHGDKSIYNPLNPKVNWMKMISSTETNDDTKNSAHLSISMGWTGIKEPLLNHLMDQIDKMYEYNQTLPRVPVLDETYDLTLLELVQKLVDIGGLPAIERFFGTYGYTVSKYVPGAVGIKYIDGLNRIWRPRWAREARGRFYWIGGPQVIELKNTLQRGIEVLTKAHTDSGIEQTQDVDPKSLEIFDTTQQEIIKAFGGNNPIDSYLTAKVDGSLLIVNIYPKKCIQYPIIKNLALAYGSDFIKLIVNYCLENNLPLVTISTQGTLFIAPDMEDYFLTSIKSLISTPIDDMSDWSNVIPQFVSLFMEYCQGMWLEPDLMVNMCFEAYCQDRVTITGKLHPELAVGYDHNGFNLLGMMYAGKYVPHFNMPRKIFKQPFYIHVNSTNQVYDLMKKLDSIVLSDLTTEQFLSDYKLDEFTSQVIHPEGFVMLTPQKNNTYDYAKIKTQLYYSCHKVRPGCIKKLLLLPTPCQNYYPILRSMHLFFDNLDQTIKLLITESLESLKEEIKIGSELYQMQNIKGQARWDQVIASGIENADSKQVDVVYRMMLNTRNSMEQMTRIIGKTTEKLYKSKADNIVNYTKNLLMKVEPWNPEWLNRLEKLFGSFDDSINELYGIVVGFTD